VAKGPPDLQPKQMLQRLTRRLQKCAYQAKIFLAKTPEQILYGGLLRERLKFVGPVKRLNGFCFAKKARKLQKQPFCSFGEKRC
jgi:hypothetical protein